jgi:hypothetical protein
MAGAWRRLRNEELHNVDALPYIIRVIKSRTRAGHIARMGGMRIARRSLVGNLKGRDHLGDLGVDGRIIFE